MSDLEQARDNVLAAREIYKAAIQESATAQRHLIDATRTLMRADTYLARIENTRAGEDNE